MKTVSDGDIYYDPFDLEIDKDPHPTWRRLRDEKPLYYNDKHDFYALSRFEDVELPCGAFDAAFSATAFHWIDPAIGWAKVADVLQPGGVFALLTHMGFSPLDEQIHAASLTPNGSEQSSQVGFISRAMTTSRRAAILYSSARRFKRSDRANRKSSPLSRRAADFRGAGWRPDKQTEICRRRRRVWRRAASE